MVVAWGLRRRWLGAMFFDPRSFQRFVWEVPYVCVVRFSHVHIRHVVGIDSVGRFDLAKGICKCVGGVYAYRFDRMMKIPFHD